MGSYAEDASRLLLENQTLKAEVERLEGDIEIMLATIGQRHTQLQKARDGLEEIRDITSCEGEERISEIAQQTLKDIKESEVGDGETEKDS